MRKIIYVIIFVFSFMFAFSGCTVEMSDNGEIDGFWHLKSIDSLENGNLKDVTYDRIYWSIQLNLIDVRFMDNKYKECIIQFNKEGDSLLLSNPCYFNHTEGDVKITNISALKPYGINSLNEKFLIETANSNRMVLRSEKLRLHFKKI